MDDCHDHAIELELEYEDQISFYLGSDLYSTLHQQIAQQSQKNATPSEQLIESKSHFEQSPNNNKMKNDESPDTKSKGKDLHLTIPTGGPSDWLRVSPDLSEHDRSVSPSSPGYRSSSFHTSSTSTLSSIKSEDVFSKTEQMFEVHERMFHEEIMSLSPSTPRTPTRSPSKSPGLRHQSVAIENLDNLVRILEQLSNLREQNVQLKKKCAYLEDTKSLLQQQNDMLTGIHKTKQKGKMSPITHQPIRMSTFPKTKQHGQVNEEQVKTCSSPLLNSRKRSQSVGSLDRMDNDTDSQKGGPKGSKMDGLKLHRRKFSKWERVKRVFTGKPEPGSKAEETSLTKPRDQLPSISPTVMVQDATMDFDQLTTKSKPIPCPIEIPKGDIVQSEPPSPGSIHSEPAIPSVDIERDRFADFESPYVFLQQMSVPDASDLRRLSMTCESTSGASVSDGGEDDTPFAGSKETLKDEDSEEEVDNTANFLQVAQLRRRRSSPTLTLEDTEQAVAESESMQESPIISRSSSFKSNRKMSAPNGEGKPKRTTRSVDRAERFQRRGKSLHGRRTAWGRVKDIIHTRRDSLKKRTKKDSESRSEAVSDGELPDYPVRIYDDFDSAPAALDYEYECDTPKATTPRMSRKSLSEAASPPSSPIFSRKSNSMKSGTDSPPRRQLQRPASAAFIGQSVDLTALLGGMSDDFSKKMQEWEDKKTKKPVGAAKESSGTEAEEAQKESFSKDFIKKMEEWEKIKGIGSPPSTSKGGGSASFSPEKSCSPTEFSTLAPSAEELQQRLSDSFSKKLQEWERIKSQRAKEGSPTPGEKKIKKEDKTKSKKEKESDKTKLKVEKTKSKDKSGFEKVKETLSEMRIKGLAGMEMALSEIRREGLSEDFTKKLHEWELIKGLKQEHSETTTSTLVHAAAAASSAATLQSQQVHVQQVAECAVREEQLVTRERVHSDGSIQEISHFSESSTAEHTRSTHASLDRCMTDPVLPVFDNVSLVDDSTSIDLNITSENILSLEKTNQHLVEELKQKDEDMQCLHDEVCHLQDRINTMNNQHQADIETYKRELWATSRLGRVTIETDLMAATVSELKQKIEQLELQGEILANEKCQAESHAYQQAEDRCQTEARLIEEIKQLREVINSANKGTHGEQAHVTGGQDFEKLYDYVLKLQVKLNDIKLDMMERNKLINDMKRHLMMQEVTNILLQAGMNRRELELSYFKEAKRLGVLRRWKTFAGAEFKYREEQKHDGRGRPHIVQRHHGHKTCKDFETIISKLKHTNPEAILPTLDWLDRRDARGDGNGGKSYSPGQSLKGQGKITVDAQQQFSSPKPQLISVGVQAILISQPPVVKRSTIGVQSELTTVVNRMAQTDEILPKSPPEDKQLSVGIQTTLISMHGKKVQTSETMRKSPPRIKHTSVGVQHPYPQVTMVTNFAQTDSVPKTPVKVKYSHAGVQCTRTSTVGKMVQTVIINTEDHQTQTVRTRRTREMGNDVNLINKAVQTMTADNGSNVHKVPVRRQAKVDQDASKSVNVNLSSPDLKKSRTQHSKGTTNKTTSITTRKTTSTEGYTITKTGYSPSTPVKKWTSKLTSEDNKKSTDSIPSTQDDSNLEYSFTVKVDPQISLNKTSEQLTKVPDHSANERKSSAAKKKREYGSQRETLSDWLKREPKPPTVMSSGSFAVGSPPPETEHLKTETVTTCIISASPVKEHSLKKQAEKPPYIVQSPRKDSVDTTSITSTCTEDSDVFMDARSHPPHSPMIRSKNARKLRQEHECPHRADVYTWQATPPRRHLRHRRTSPEKSEKNLDSENSSPKSPPVINRGRSRTRQSVNTTGNGTSTRAFSVETSFRITDPSLRIESRLRARDRLQSVQATISKFEKRASETDLSQPDSPVSTRGTSTSSGPPRRPRVSPVRRLKSAAELLQESENERNQSVSKCAVPDRMEVTTTTLVKTRATSSSSDKENHHDSKVHQIVRRFSNESTPARSTTSSISESMDITPTRRRTPSPSTVSSNMIREAVRKLSASLSSDFGNKTKPILKDRTNDGQVKKITDSFQNGSVGGSPVDGSTPTGSHTPGSRASPSRTISDQRRTTQEGTVQKHTDMYESKKSASDSGKIDKIGSRKSSLSESNILNVKHDTSLSVDNSDKPSHGQGPSTKKKDSSMVKRSKSSVKTKTEMPEITPKELQKRNRSLSPSKARRFFTRSKESPASGAGVLSALCKQTMVFDAEKSSIDSSVSSKADDDAITKAEGENDGDKPQDKRKSRGKFLDGNWLQKPRRFFRVSKS